MRDDKKAYLLLLAAVVFWGFSFISIKASLAVFPPMVLGFARYAPAILVLAAIKAARARGERLARKDLPMVAGSGLIGVTLYFFMENNGVKLNSASEASLIIAAIPVMLVVAERVIDRKKLSARRYFGALATMAGVAVLVARGLSFSGSAAGYLFMLGAGISWVAYSFMTRGLFSRYSRISIVFWQSAAGFIGFIPLAAAEAGSVGTPDAAIVLHVAFLGIFCSALGYYFYAIALERLGPATSGLFINLIPVVTVAASLLLGENMSGTQALGGAIVVGGVTLATWEGGKRPT